MAIEQDDAGMLDRLERILILHAADPDYSTESVEDDPRAMRAYIRSQYARWESIGVRPPAYLIDWLRVFTPIERMAWSAIRYRGLPLLPQYPIGPYFADFADPDVRIVLECDGKQFHQDAERDAARDLEMAQQGWSVFRVSGRECYAPEIDWEHVVDKRRDSGAAAADDLVERWMLHSADGVIAALGSRYYDRPLDAPQELVRKTLWAHCATKHMDGRS